MNPIRLPFWSLVPRPAMRASVLARCRASLATLLLVVQLTPAAAAQFHADFTVDVTAGTNPLTVNFTDATTGGTPLAWAWNFGDGHVSQLKNPTHTYTLPGSHTVSLSVIGPGFQVDEEVKLDLISVAPQPLFADFSASPVQGSNPLTVDFTDLSSGNPPTAWLWNFGDGQQSTAQHTTHVYGTPGTYDVSLTVFIDQQSDTTTQVGAIQVDPTSLDADFSFDVSEGTSPLAVSFTDTSSGGAPITSRLWTFGDGSSSTAANPTHVYDVQATTSFDVSLTVSIGGQSATKTVVDAVTVEPGLYDPEEVLKVFATQDVVLYEAADLDGDGRQDLLAFVKPSIVQDGNLVYLPNLGDPTAFGGSVQVGPHLPAAPNEARAVDIDGDGDRDVVSTSAGEVSWVENLDGAGTFATLAGLVGDSGFSSTLRDLPTVDFDGDGDIDVVGGSNLGVIWFENLDGAGTFAPVQAVESIQGVSSLDVADLDGDGDLDILAAVGDGLAWWEHVDGTATFAGPIAVHEHKTTSYWAAAADMDDDGDVDVVGRYVGLDFEPLGYRVYRNVDGQGTFALVQSVFSFENSSGSFLVDPDGDGDIDLVDVRRTAAPAGGLWWSENHGGALPMQPIRPLAIIDFATYPTITDLDGDGDDDIAVTFFQAGDEGISWYANRLGSVAWPFLGDGLQGALGMPLLQGEGALSGGATITLRLANGPPGAAATLVGGVSLLGAPFKGGVLVPSLDLILPMPPLDAGGALALDATWPTGLPAGVPIWFQYWLVDPSGPVGFSASNAVMATTQP